MEDAVNYDPHYISSDRRQANKNKPFENFEVEGLCEEINWTGCPKDSNDDKDMKED